MSVWSSDNLNRCLGEPYRIAETLLITVQAPKDEYIAQERSQITAGRLSFFTWGGRLPLPPRLLIVQKEPFLSPLMPGQTMPLRL